MTPHWEGRSQTGLQETGRCKKISAPEESEKYKTILRTYKLLQQVYIEFSKVAKPFTELLKKEVAFKWETPQEEAFITLRDALCRNSIL